MFRAGRFERPARALSGGGAEPGAVLRPYTPHMGCTRAVSECLRQAPCALCSAAALIAGTGPLSAPEAGCRALHGHG